MIPYLKQLTRMHFVYLNPFKFFYSTSRGICTLSSLVFGSMLATGIILVACWQISLYKPFADCIQKVIENPYSLLFAGIEMMQFVAHMIIDVFVSVHFLEICTCHSMDASFAYFFLVLIISSWTGANVVLAWHALPLHFDRRPSDLILSALNFHSWTQRCPTAGWCRSFEPAMNQ